MRLFAVCGLVALAAVLAGPVAASAAVAPAARTVSSAAGPDAKKAAGDLLDVSCVTDKYCVAVGANK